MQICPKDEPLLLRFSSFNRLQRSLAYCLRFINNCQRGREKLNGHLTVEEIRNTLLTVWRVIQEQYFSNEIRSLQTETTIERSSKIISLNQFLGKDGLLRVGGRLTNASIPYDQRHPIIFTSHSHTVQLLIFEEHKRLFHAGPQGILNSIRLRYWPVSAMKQIKKVIKSCVVCHRFRAASQQQLMGQLPMERVTSSRPFLRVGIDFGGPLYVRESRIKRQ